MRAGDLHDTMDIYRKTMVINSFGDAVYSSSVWKQGVRCKVMHLGTPSAGASEYSDDSQEVGEMKIEFKCRYISGLQFNDLAYYNGAYFNVYSILPIGKREGMRVRAYWRDSQGPPIPTS
jgi:hypothetical protein